MKKLSILFVLLLLLLAGCSKEAPPPADTPEPPAHSGTFVSPYGSMVFSGDGTSVVIDFTPELADALGLPSGKEEGTYVFTFQNAMYRYDRADGFTITVGDQACQFLNIFQETNETTITLLSPINDRENIAFAKEN